MSKPKTQEKVYQELTQAFQKAFRRIQKRYTFSTRVGDGLWDAGLVIDHQKFTIVTDRSYKEALWYRRQLSIALERLIDHETTSLI
jgi:hypothetical protein